VDWKKPIPAAPNLRQPLFTLKDTLLPFRRSCHLAWHVAAAADRLTLGRRMRCAHRDGVVVWQRPPFRWRKMTL
jgi:hypothetical protein